MGINGKLQAWRLMRLTLYLLTPFCFEVQVTANSKRAFIELKYGRIDLGWAASYTDERAKYVHFSDNYRTEVMRLYENKNNQHSVKNLEDIFKQGFIVGANFGSYYGESLSNIKLNIKAD
ncbi:ABC transporter substrate-binding protein [Pseudoalteromonas sp. B193]